MFDIAEYHFYITGHQGNIRVVASQNGEVEQVNHYYPYGGESTGSDAQPYKYNGMELDRHSGFYRSDMELLQDDIKIVQEMYNNSSFKF